MAKGKNKSRSITEKKFVDYGAGGQLQPYCPVDVGEPDARSSELFYARDGQISRTVVVANKKEEDGRSRPSKRIEDALDWYHFHKPQLFTLHLYEAGKWIRDRYELAGRNGYRISDMNGDRVRGGVREHDSASLGLTALEEVYNALDTVGGPDLDDVLLEVVCRGLTMKEFEKKKKWRSGAGLPVFRIALHRLAEFRGLIDPKRLRSPKHARIRAI